MKKGVVLQDLVDSGFLRKYSFYEKKITTYGVKNNKYRSIVGKEVVLDDLFRD